MKSMKVNIAILLLLLLSVIAMPVGMNSHEVEALTTTQIDQHTTSGYISDVPYVWQEIAGYCFFAAMSMSLQGMGMDLDMDDLFAATGSGFSALYFNAESEFSFFPGIFARQMSYFEFFCELYGLDMTLYIDTSTDWGSNSIDAFEVLESGYRDYNNTSTDSPFNVLRESIDAGIPLAIATDVYYLPPVDYDIFRQYAAPLDAGGIAHAITIVGYNDTSQEVQIQDPGVGLFGESYGYPEDGRWNYSMSYISLNTAWQSAGYLTFCVSPGSGQVDDFEERLGDYICKRMRGDRTSYFQGYENYYFLSPGKTAFSGLGLDLTVESIRNYAVQFTDAHKPEAFLYFGHNLEAVMTMQYHSYRAALRAIPDILPGVDLQEFIDAADDALPHLEILSHNASSSSGYDLIFRDSLVFQTFEEIALDYPSLRDIDATISLHLDQLNEIRDHLFAIAESWEAAADALEEALGIQNTTMDEGSILIAAGGTGIIVLAAAILLFRRKNH